jgi:hypothetical protein
MALSQLLLRFWVTDHGGCHFREESLEKVTVVTSKRHEELSKSSKSSNSRFTKFSELVGWCAARGIPERISLSKFAMGLGETIRSEVSFQSSVQFCFNQLYRLLRTKIRSHIRFAKRI